MLGQKQNVVKQSFVLISSKSYTKKQIGGCSDNTVGMTTTLHALDLGLLRGTLYGP